jgi:hypothetical protein
MFDNKKKTGKGSGHNEYHEKVNKCKTLVEKDTYAVQLSLQKVVMLNLELVQFWLFLAAFRTPMT